MYCAGNDAAFEFLQDVLSEVLALFPASGFISAATRCRRSIGSSARNARPACQGAKNEKELQSYFVRRIERFLNAQGRTLIGWDEILEGRLPPRHRHELARHGRRHRGRQAGHDAVMTPRTTATLIITRGKRRAKGLGWIFAAGNGLCLRADAASTFRREGQAHSRRCREPMERAFSQLRPYAIHGVSAPARWPR